MTKAKRPGIHLKVLVMGPPCVEFSGLNRQAKGRYSFGGSLLLQSCRLAAEMKAECVVIENVEKLRTQYEAFLTDVKAVLGEMYLTVEGALDPPMFGQPVLRPRLYIVGFQGDETDQEALRQTWPQEGNAIRGIFEDEEGRLAPRSLEIDWSRYLDDQPEPLLLVTKVFADGTIAEERNKWDQLHPKLCEAFDLAANEPLSEEALEGAEVKVALDKEGRPIFWDRSFGLKSYHGVCPTVARSGQLNSGVLCEIDGKVYPRNLTGREAVRLQGFPDDWLDVPHMIHPDRKLTDAEIYSLMGNSMNIHVLRWLLGRIDNILAPQWDRGM